MHITVAITAQKIQRKQKFHATVLFNTAKCKLLPKRGQAGIRFPDEITCDGN